MRKVVFETATLLDAVTKANRIAPKKGTAADIAAGITVRVDPLSLTEPVVIEATDLEVSFRQVVSVLQTGDEPALWRVPARLFYGVTSTLPTESGSQVMLAEKDGKYLQFRSGKTKAKLNLIMGDAPIIRVYDIADLAQVKGLALRLRQVAWACADREGILSGVHMDGEWLIATDKTKAAVVPCKVPVDRPVTAPLAQVAALIKNTDAVAMRASENHLELSPDEYTQTTAILYVQEYPAITKLMESVKPEWSVKVNTEELLGALARMMVLTKAERFPVITIRIGLNTMQMEMEEKEVGKIADEIEVQGGNDEEFSMRFTPQNLKEAVEASGRAAVYIDYGPTSKSLVRVRDDNDYLALLTPRAPGTT